VGLRLAHELDGLRQLQVLRARDRAGRGHREAERGLAQEPAQEFRSESAGDARRASRAECTVIMGSLSRLA
jgi:hypothetical protein